MSFSKAIQSELDLFAHKPRLADVAPQCGHAPNFRRGDRVFWVEWEYVSVEKIFRRRNGEAGVKRVNELKPTTKWGRIICRHPERDWGFWVRQDGGKRLILYSVEMKLHKRPCRGRSLRPA